MIHEAFMSTTEEMHTIKTAGIANAMYEYAGNNHMIAWFSSTTIANNNHIE
jgi:hypothetical protein